MIGRPVDQRQVTTAKWQNYFVPIEVQHWRVQVLDAARAGPSSLGRFGTTTIDGTLVDVAELVREKLIR